MSDTRRDLETRRLEVEAQIAKTYTPTVTDPYTPTTEEVLDAWVETATADDSRAHLVQRAHIAARRWLANHDAALRKQIAREIRAEAEHYGPAWGDGMEYAARLAEQGSEVRE